jgi:hypothetical protein
MSIFNSIPPYSILRKKKILSEATAAFLVIYCPAEGSREEMVRGGCPQ